MAKKRNGKTKILRGERKTTLKARERVFKAAKKRGIITSAQACKVGNWGQAWFHLNAMVDAGQMEYAGYNRWLPARRR